MNIYKFILTLFGWKFNNSMELLPEKAIIVQAPHTSIFDFIWGWLGLRSFGIKPKIVIKSEMFFFPLGLILKSMGAIPIKRGKKNNLSNFINQNITKHESFHLIITVEGTRKKTTRWKKGFWILSKETGLPVIYGFIDYKHKALGMKGCFDLTDNWDDDIKRLKKEYENVTAKYPDNFTTD